MLRFYSNISMRGSHIYDCPDLAHVIYQQDHNYLEGDLVVNNNRLYVATHDFTSQNAGPKIEDDFNADVTALHLKLTSFGDGVSIQEYAQGVAYKKDTLVYLGDRMGRVALDFTSDSVEATVQESYDVDKTAKNIIVDKIAIDELDEQLLKAIPIVAFVDHSDIPRFENGVVISGAVPKFRDGSTLTTIERKGASFLYIVETNGDLIGMGLITQYDETADEFTVNAMKYGTGLKDNILACDHILTKREVGEFEIISKDQLLGPKLTIKSTPPVDTTQLWFESNELDSREISVGTINVKQYNTTTHTWDPDTYDLKSGDIVKNENGTDWQYYRIQLIGHVGVSVENWQLVYDKNQTLGKVIDVDTLQNQVTIRIIHSGSSEATVLTEDVTANAVVGAAPIGTTFPKGMSFTEFVKKISLKDILASFNFTASGSGLKKKGTSVNGSTLALVFTNLGNVPIQDIVFYHENTVLDTQPYVSGTSTYTFVFPIVITDTTTFSVAVNQDNSYVSRKSVKFTFVNPSYIGTCSTLTPSSAEILTMVESLKEGKGGTYTQNISDARTCYAYPASMGNLTHIKDDNNFEYINSFTKTTDTINGETYNVYTLTDPVTATNFVWKFE